MKNISDLFVPYDYAIKLKELGFKDKCLASFYTKVPENIVSNGENWGGKFNGLEFHESENDYEPNFVLNSDKEYYVASPLWQQAFDFLLELLIKKHKTDYRISYYADGSGCISLNDLYTCYFENDGWVDIQFKTKKECLTHLINLINKK